MERVSLPVIALFVASVAGQLVAVSLLPRTEGFRNVIPTFACAAVFVFSIWMLARLTHTGANLSIVLPLMAAVVPLGAIAIGVMMYGESASVLKVVVLVGACGLIGVASRIA